MEKDYTEFDERVDKFLAGEMSSEEEKSFYETLEADEELKDRALTIAATVKEMEAVSREKEVRLIEGMKCLTRKDFEKVIGKLSTTIPFVPANEHKPAAASVARTTVPMEENKPKNSTRSAKVIPLWRKPIFKYAAAAVVLICVIFSGQQMYICYQYSNVLDGIQVAYLSSAPTKGTESEEGIEQQQLTRLFNDIEAGKNITKTISQLELLYEQSQSETYTVYTNYAAEISWNLAIAYIKNRDKGNAIKILEKIESDYVGKPLANEAKLLKEKL